MKELRNALIERFIGTIPEEIKQRFYLIILTMFQFDQVNFLLAVRELFMDRIVEDKLLIDESNYENYKKIVWHIGQIDIDEKEIRK